MVEVSVNVNEITQAHIDIAKKFGVDLTYYLDEIIIEAVNEPIVKKTRTRKK
jgi:aryl-phospho-beta-D-glucosidase BglC (GH1 family)